VCETGFGLGHNFLALWQAWRADPHRPGRLHVVSFEAHPFHAADLLDYYQRVLPAPVRELGKQLIGAWPVLVPGVHQLAFENGAIQLTLFLGPVEQMARQLDARVDAFFLDGFSPKVNPAMWSRELFGQLVRVANAGATAATWCCAGAVRRALSDEGFLVEKVPGFGGKHEMTVATLRSSLGAAGLPSRPQTAVVIGAGIAGAATASALALRGCQVSVFDPVLAKGRGGAHAGHRAVAVSPMLNRTDDLRARFSRAGVLHAWRKWSALAAPATTQRCGTFYPALSAQQAGERQTVLKQLSFPEQWVCWLDPDQAQQRVGGYWPFGQRVQPQPLLEALLGQPEVQCRPAQVARILPATNNGQWRVVDHRDQELACADLVVLANAAGAAGLLGSLENALRFPRLQARSVVAGEVYYQPARYWPSFQAIVAGHGYAVPADDGTLVLGSTYRRDASQTSLSHDGCQQVLEKMRVLLSGQCPEAGGVSVAASVAPGQGWAGWRASVSDRFPVVGQAGLPGLWVNACHASRGFSGSALAADIIAAAEFGEPLPIERDLHTKLALR
jgi:tRNA 5-methylaminomethyl-2-thiouridine biosynthesis bifunctional protein